MTVTFEPGTKVIHPHTGNCGIVQEVKDDWCCFVHQPVKVARVIYEDGYECWTSCNELSRIH